MRVRGLVLLLLMTLTIQASAARGRLSRSQQCLVVTATDWESKTGTLRAFERVDNAWKMHGPEVRVVLGKKGLGWGLGVVAIKNAIGPRKIEGDNKAPAGVFKLGPAFGYAPQRDARWIKLAYVRLKKDTEGVDDSRSRYYNQLVDRSRVARVDWQSSEQMLRADNLYKWGIVVAHNSAAKPRAGSCIFLHIWKNSAAATAGCTAMPEKNLVDLLRWLDPAARPILVQMPRASYVDVAANLALPRLPR
jgi:L,D-peptidoglycan transpeptidase YkuD (ErfK/YbiS/YcfS/YnhG family)